MLTNRICFIILLQQHVVIARFTVFLLCLLHPVIYLLFELRILTRNKEKSATNLFLVPCPYLFIRALEFDLEQGPGPRLFLVLIYLFQCVHC